MKLIDLIELLFKPAPVQFEPCEWRGGAADEFIMPAEYFFPTTKVGYPLAGWYFHYPNGALETVSRPRFYPAVKFVPRAYRSGGWHGGRL